MLNKHTNRRWTKVIVFSLVAVLSLVAPLANIGRSALAEENFDYATCHKDTPDGSGTRVSYNLNGVAPTVYISESQKVPVMTIDFDGKTFLGWNSDPSGKGKSYKAGDTVDDSMTLYAQWKDGTH